MSDIELDLPRPNSRASGLLVVYPERLRTLKLRLEALVEANPELGDAAHALLYPVVALRNMATLAPAALGDDWVAIEALRLLASVSSPFELSMQTGSNQSVFAGTSFVPPYKPCLLDPGGLVVLALAAYRIASGVSDPDVYALPVHALANACGPAEALCRLTALDDATLVSILSALGVHGDERLLWTGPLRSLVHPQEAARRQSLKEILAAARASVLTDEGELAVPAVQWDASPRGAHLTGVEPARALPGELLTLRGDFALERVPRVLFAFTDGATLAPRAVVAPLEDPPDLQLGPTVGELLVRVPDEARLGWIGLLDDALAKRAGDDRAALREFWAAFQHPALTDGVPVDHITSLSEPPVPPRTAANVFRGGRPVVHFAGTLPAELTAQQSFDVVWEAVGADELMVQRDEGGEWLDAAPAVPASDGQLRLVAPDVDQAATLRLRLIAIARIGDDDVAPRELRSEPRVLDVPVRPGAPDSGEAEGPGEAGDAAPAIVLRPRFFASLPADGDPEELQRATDVRTLGAQLRESLGGAAPSLAELPFLPDSLAAFVGPLSGEDDPRVVRALDGLARLALRTPGAEDALWVLLVPEPEEGEPWSRLLDAEAARGVAVATPAALPQLLRDPALAPRPERDARVPERRVRISADLERDGRAVLRELRVEERAAARPLSDAEIMAVGRDRRDVVLFVHPVRMGRAGEPLRLHGLPAAPAELARVELWHRTGVPLRVRPPVRRPALTLPTPPPGVSVAALARPSVEVALAAPAPIEAPAPPFWTRLFRSERLRGDAVVSLDDVRFEGDRLSWSTGATDGGVPRVAVEVSAGGQPERWVPLADYDGRAQPVRSPLERLTRPAGGGDDVVVTALARVRLVARAGFELVASAPVDAPLPPGPFALRSLGRRLYFVDAPDDWTVDEWLLDGEALADSAERRFLRASDELAGALTVRVRDAAGEARESGSVTVPRVVPRQPWVWWFS